MMRDFEVGSMVRQKMFKPFHGDDAVFRYGIVTEKISLPYAKEELFFKVIWQPNDSFPVSRNRSYTDNVSGEKLELVSAPAPHPRQNINAKGRPGKV